LLLAAQVVAFHWRILFRFDRYQTPWDFQAYYYPLAEFFTRSLQRGDWPLWEPYTYSGQPLFANINVQMFYPPWLALTGVNLLLGGGHTKYFLELNLMGHVLLAGFGTWLLLRGMGAGFWSALAAGTMYQLGGFYASQPQYLGALCSAAWFPLAWLAIVKLAADPSARRWVALLGAALGMSILAGAPCVFIVMYVASAELALLMVLTRQAEARLLGPVAAGMLLGALLAAIQIVPTAEVTRLSVASFRYEAVVAGGGVLPGALWSLVVPNYWNVYEIGKLPWTYRSNPTFYYLFVGWTGIAAAAASIVVSMRRATPFLVVGVLSALWMCGENTWIGKAVYLALPAPLRNPLYAEYAMVGVALPLAVMAGLALSKWPRLAVPAAALLSAELIWLSSNRPFNVADVVEEAPTVSRDSFEWQQGLPSEIRTRLEAATPPYRLELRDASNTWLWGAPVLEIPFASGNDAFALRRYVAVRSLLADKVPGRFQRRVLPEHLESRIPDMLGVAYLLTAADASVSKGLGKGKWTEAARLAANHVLYRNATPLPRFYLTPATRSVADIDEALAAMRDPAFDPEAETLVEGAGIGPGGGRGSVRVVRYSPDDFEIEATTSAAAFLATSEVWYPGWRVSISGSPAELQVANGAFRGVRVPAGTSRVRMWLAPWSLWIGGGASLLGAGALLWLLTGGATARRRSPPRTSPPS
jgi:hypothetical protein